MRLHTLDFGITSSDLTQLESLHGKRVRIIMEVDLESSGQVIGNFIGDDNYVEIKDYPFQLEVESLDGKTKVSI